MAEFKFTRFRYTWKNTWASSTAYKRDDVVRVSGSTFVCLEGHTSDASFAVDLASEKWVKMSDGVLWTGNWTNSTVYNVGDLVFNGGQVYICLARHQSQNEFYLDFANWAVYTEGNNWTNDWLPSTVYNIGDLIKYNGIVYRCIAGHTSNTTANGIEVGNQDGNDDSTAELWSVVNEGKEYVGNWTQGTRYRKNDLVKFGGTIWRCTDGHTSGDDSSLNFNEDLFTLEIPGQQFLGQWNEETPYSVGDTVLYGGNLYISTDPDISENPVTSPGAWSLVVSQYNYRGNWNSVNDYKIGDVVSSGGNLFKAESDAEGKTPETVVVNVTVGGPESLDSGNKYYLDGVYKPQFLFEIGNTYVFNLTDPTNAYYPNDPYSTENPHPFLLSADNANGELGGGTTYLTNVILKLDEKIVTKEQYIEGYASARTRSLTITIDAGTPSLYYYCTVHLNMGNYMSVVVPSTGVNPALNPDWSILVYGQRWANGWDNNLEYSVGDIVTFRNKTYMCLVAHWSNELENYPENGNGFNYWQVVLEGDEDNALSKLGDILTYGLRRDGSTLGPIEVDIGNQGELLTIQSDDQIDWQKHGNQYNRIYVGPNGVDADGYGINRSTPFKTIRYACEYTDLNLSGLTKIEISTGTYDEILPIIIPANTAIVGAELRSTTVRPASPIAALANDSSYTKSALSRLKDIIAAIIGNISIIPTPGNTFSQITVYAAGSSAASDELIDKIDDIIQYIDFYIESSGTDPTISGSNSATTDIGYIRASTNLLANKEFLANELAAYISQTFPDYDFDPELCRRDVRRYIDALVYDLIYSGNYKSILAARYYRNAVLGNSGEDMFYVRDNTGVRNCSLKGLQGNLNPPLAFELYRRPTGGSYISLDPGWGPNDTRTWITNRSPYIQGVSTFGTACIGQKIDGSLHNGGNKSVVSNDFTQVISDGIGAWVTDGARAELVSVFTYYAQIGYFAERGGIIRATNGNCSYGDYGALADGNDPNETPKYASVNNRTGEPEITTAISGELASEILAVEFNNAGSNYSSATWSFVGSGSGVSVEQTEFRDDAVYRTYIPTVGGGYTNINGNAQSGGVTTIQLESDTDNTEEQLLGLRIFITSGPGTGQYGYISAFSTGTKIATIRRESNDELGWDHILPGTPSNVLLTNQTAYRIEPRVIFDEPGFTSSTVNLSLGIDWANIAYGETTETYNGITGDLGDGDTVDVLPEAAVWNVSKVGRSYTVTLSEAGAGYAVGQTIVIDGSSLGGDDIDNDVRITVTAISDDSTNSITAFRYEGVGRSGRWVATGLTSQAVAYSSDGSTWGSNTMPSSGDWNCLTSGNNRFVAIRNDSASAAYSLNGITWTARTLPISRLWNAVTYGGVNGQGIFLAVAGDQNSGVYSRDGITWSQTTLPTFGDSAFNEWVDVTYGGGKFVAIANTENICATGVYNYSTNTITWEGHIMDSISDSTQVDWKAVAYGNNRFVAIASTGEIGYSFDGQTWYSGGNLPSQDGSTAMVWNGLSYGQGVFVATCDTGSKIIGDDPSTGPTTYMITSYDGIIWQDRVLSAEHEWKTAAFGNPDTTLGDSTLVGNNTGRWVILPKNLTSDACLVYTGARALGRVVMSAGTIGGLVLWEPGSGYSSEPSVILNDPNNTSDFSTICRLGDGALAQPSFIDRGAGYRTSTTRVTVTGNGFAEEIPTFREVVIDELVTIPGPGSQLRFRGETSFYTIVQIIESDINEDGSRWARFQISPYLNLDYFLEHNTAVEIRESYSQCRITGHDFLDVGTGNFEETNYPELYSEGNFVSAPENEVYESNGGRVFYVSTDQSGNFRTGELFSVEQATGIVTISADFFDFEGLTELALGGVRLGGSGVVIREFSTDPLFTQDSNNVIPTQRAIKAYLTSRLNVGGSDLLTPQIQAGIVKVGPQEITTTTGTGIDIIRRVEFSGDKANLNGFILAQTMFHRSFFAD